MPHRIIPRMVHELSVFAYIPLSVLAWLDPVVFSQIATAITGILVAFFAIRFYRANTRKIEVEREVAELERDKLKMENQAMKLQESKPKKTGRTSKKSQDDD